MNWYQWKGFSLRSYFSSEGGKPPGLPHLMTPDIAVSGSNQLLFIPQGEATSRTISSNLSQEATEVNILKDAGSARPSTESHDVHSSVFLTRRISQQKNPERHIPALNHRTSHLSVLAANEMFSIRLQRGAQIGFAVAVALK